MIGADLKSIPTEDLVSELQSRKNVKKVSVGTYQRYGLIEKYSDNRYPIECNCVLLIGTIGKEHKEHMETELVKGETLINVMDVSEKVKDAVEEIAAGYLYRPETLEIINTSAYIIDTSLKGYSYNDVKACVKYIIEIYERIKVG